MCEHQLQWRVTNRAWQPASQPEARARRENLRWDLQKEGPRLPQKDGASSRFYRETEISQWKEQVVSPGSSSRKPNAKLEWDWQKTYGGEKDSKEWRGAGWGVMVREELSQAGSGLSLSRSLLRRREEGRSI